MRPPCPRRQPPTTNSCRETFLILRQSGERQARLVDRAQPFGHDAFQAVVAGDRQDAGARVAGERGRDLPAAFAVAQAEAFQQLAPLRVRHLQQRLPGCVQHVEDQVGGGDPVGQPGRGRRRGDVHARLQLGEARAAVLERHDSPSSSSGPPLAAASGASSG